MSLISSLQNCLEFVKVIRVLKVVRPLIVFRVFRVFRILKVIRVARFIEVIRFLTDFNFIKNTLKEYSQATGRPKILPKPEKFKILYASHN